MARPASAIGAMETRMRRTFIIALVGIAGLWSGISEAATNRLTWTDNSANETTFHVERKAVACGAAGTFAEIATVAANVVTYDDTTAVEGTPYCYRVRASNSAGFSAYSNEAGRTPPVTLPAAPSGLTVQ